jgi:hypothetical protein
MTGKNRLVIAATIIVLGMIMGCRKAELDIDAYAAWVEDPGNGLRQEKKIGSFIYTIQYTPVDYMLMSELGKEKVSKEDIPGRRKEIEGMQYIGMRLSSDGPGDVMMVGAASDQDYMKRVNYFAYEAQNDIQLLDGNDTLPCRLFHYTQNYGIAPHADFIMAFERPEEELVQNSARHDKVLIITDKILGNGIVKFTITKDNINNSPSLMIK